MLCLLVTKEQTLYRQQYALHVQDQDEHLTMECTKPAHSVVAHDKSQPLLLKRGVMPHERTRRSNSILSTQTEQV